MTITKGNNLAFISNQVAWNKDLEVIEVGDLTKQIDMIYQNIEQALLEIGATWVQIEKQRYYTTMPTEYEILGLLLQNTLMMPLHQLKRL